MHRAILRSLLLAAGLSGTRTNVSGFAFASTPDFEPQGEAHSTKGAESAKRTVLVTGANRGIGLELARQYHEAGWMVIATARDPEAAKDLRAVGDDVLVPRLDVTNTESVHAL